MLLSRKSVVVVVVVVYVPLIRINDYQVCFLQLGHANVIISDNRK